MMNKETWKLFIKVMILDGLKEEDRPAPEELEELADDVIKSLNKI